MSAAGSFAAAWARFLSRRNAPTARRVHVSGFKWDGRTSANSSLYPWTIWVGLAFTMSVLTLLSLRGWWVGSALPRGTGCRPCVLGG